MTTHQPKKKTLKYYAISWTYSRGMTESWTQGGTYASCQPARFGSKAEREAWLLRGPEQYEQGYREAVTLARLPYGWSRKMFVANAARWARYGR